MGLSRNERRRLDELADQLRRQDPDLSEALSEPRPPTPPSTHPLTPGINPFAPSISPEALTQAGRWVPHTGRGLANLVGGVTGLSLFAAGIPGPQPVLLVVGVAVAATCPLFHLTLRGRRPRPDKGVGGHGD